MSKLPDPARPTPAGGQAGYCAGVGPTKKVGTRTGKEYLGASLDPAIRGHPGVGDDRFRVVRVAVSVRQSGARTVAATGVAATGWIRSDEEPSMSAPDLCKYIVTAIPQGCPWYVGMVICWGCYAPQYCPMRVISDGQCAGSVLESSYTTCGRC